MTDITTKVTVIGAGIGGVSAAIQLKRYGIDFCILEKFRVGGLVSNAHLVRNYPGFPNGISGMTLVGALRSQLKNNGVHVLHDEVLSVRHDGKFVIQAKLYRIISDYCIVATGTKALLPDIEIDDSKRVFTDLRNARNLRKKQLIIVGGGDAAIDYAFSLAPLNSVTVISRNTRLRALPALVNDLRNEPSIRLQMGWAPTKLIHSGKHLELFCTKNDVEHIYSSDCIIFAIGREANLPNIEVPSATKGLFIIGDAANGSLRQCAIAAGDGLRTAMTIYSETVA